MNPEAKSQRKYQTCDIDGVKIGCMHIHLQTADAVQVFPSTSTLEKTFWMQNFLGYNMY